MPRILARGARDPLDALDSVAAHGDVSRVGFGPLGAWLLNRPDLARYVFEDEVDGFDKGAGVTTRFLGEGLIAVDGEVHAHRRAAVAPALEAEALNGYADLVAALASDAADGWAPGTEIDGQAEMGVLNTRIAVRVFFGVDPDRKEGRLLARALDLAAAAAARLILPNLPVTERLPLPGNRAFRRSRESLDALLYELITDAREGRTERPSVLGRLANDGTLDDTQLRDEVMTMFGGHRSAAAGLAWALHLLAAHPDVDAELASEAAAREPGHPGPVARAVAAEALRLYPPIWVLPRRATREHAIDGNPVPAGATVLVSAWLLHRDERWWPRPAAFEPARWLRTSDSAPHEPFAYFPFGGGPRSCAGEALEWVELPVVLSAIRARRRLGPAGDGVQPKARVTLRAKGGIPLSVGSAG